MRDTRDEILKFFPLMQCLNGLPSLPGCKRRDISPHFFEPLKDLGVHRFMQFRFERHLPDQRWNIGTTSDASIHGLISFVISSLSVRLLWSLDKNGLPIVGVHFAHLQFGVDAKSLDLDPGFAAPKFLKKSSTITPTPATTRTACAERMLLYCRFYDNQQNMKVSDSATKKIGLPPVEIATAWANVAFAPSEAAHVCKASIVGK